MSTQLSGAAGSAWPAVAAQDWFEICQVIHRYSHAMDSRQWHLMDDVFLPEATLIMEGDVFDSRESGVGMIRRFIECCAKTHHMNTNILALSAGDGRVRTTCNFHAWHQGLGETAERELTCLGTYQDEFVRTDAGWRIARRAEAVTSCDADLASFFAAV